MVMQLVVMCFAGVLVLWLQLVAMQVESKMAFCISLGWSLGEGVLSGSLIGLSLLWRMVAGWFAQPLTVVTVCAIGRACGCPKFWFEHSCHVHVFYGRSSLHCWGLCGSLSHPFWHRVLP